MALLLLLLAAFFPVTLFAQNAALQIGGDKQLFIDYKLIEQAENVTLHVNPPLYKGAALSADQPWEAAGLGWHNVLEDEGIFKMWYLVYPTSPKKRGGTLHICYAESRDGVRWEKPVLGLVELNGSTKNNVLPVELDDSGFVFKDPQASRSSRFKMLTVRNWGKKDAGIYLYESPDGRHFSLMPTRLLDLWPDTHNEVIFDTRLNQWIAYLRSWEKRSDAPYGKGGLLPLRTISRLELGNLTGPWQYHALPTPYKLWGDSNIPAITDEMQTVMTCDERDPPETDLYNPSVVQYPWAPGVYFAFPSIFRHFPPPPAGKFNDGILDIQIAVSRDGIYWTRYRSSYIPLDIGKRTQYMGIGMLRKGNDIFQYYFDTKTTHGEDARTKSELARNAISLAVQRLDGFMSADAAYTGGSIVTPSFMFKGNTLELNINTSAAGEARVEILEDDGTAIKGFSLKEADLIQGNYVDKVVTWKNSPDVANLAGKPVKLHIVMRSTKLFAFQFTTRQGDR